MSLRDASDIVLQTLRINLAEETGIASGSIWLQYANDDYVNSRTFNTYPSIGICEVGKSRFKYQNYGCTQRGATNGDGTYKFYSPLGEKTMIVQIELFCETQAQRRLYKNIIENFLLSNKYLDTSAASDPVTGESIDLRFIDYQMNDEKPYMVMFLMDVQVGVFKETDAYTVDEILIRGQVNQELDCTGATSGSPWIVVTSGDISITGDPSV